MADDPEQNDRLHYPCLVCVERFNRRLRSQEAKDVIDFKGLLFAQASFNKTSEKSMLVQMSGKKR